MEGRFEYNVNSVGNHYLNLPHDLSANCSKSYGSSTAKGELLTYVCDITLVSLGGASINIHTAKENWVTKNAFTKWHALRDFMFRESGLSKKERGRYSKIIRPKFDFQHRLVTDDLKPINLEMTYDPVAETWSWEAAAMDGGDWDTTEIVIETNPDLPGGVVETDIFDLHLCGPNNSGAAVESVDQNWESVGMIQSYMADRSHPTAEPVDPPDLRGNPLALLKGRSESSEGTLAINADEALVGPPYNTNTKDDDCSMMNPTLAGFVSTTSSNVGVHTAYGVRIPAGLALLVCDTAGVDLKVVVRRVEHAHG